MCSFQLIGAYETIGSPKISFDVAVDGELQLGTDSYIEKGTTPAWEYYNGEM
jgi:hypothetical protein